MLHSIAPDLQIVGQSVIGVPQLLHRGLKVHTQISATGRQRQQRQVQIS